MSAEEGNQGGLGKSLVLVVLGLFVLYYGIKVMQGRDDHGSHDDASYPEVQVGEEDSSDNDHEVSVPKGKSSLVSGQDLSSLMAENAKLKQDVADLQARLYESQQKVGAVKKLLEAEALASGVK